MNYKILSRVIVGVLITSIIILGFIAILAIWEVIDDEDVIWKSLSTSITLIVVGSVTLTSLKFLEDRETKHLKVND